MLEEEVTESLHFQFQPGPERFTVWTKAAQPSQSCLSQKYLCSYLSEQVVGSTYPDPIKNSDPPLILVLHCCRVLPPAQLAHKVEVS